MNETLPVVKVKHKVYKTEMLINERDFDEKIHELADKKVAKTEKPSKSKEEKVDEELKALMGEN